MRIVLAAFFVTIFYSAQAQEQRADGTWWDNNLTWHVQADLLRKFGELEICIWDTKREMCVTNLMTAYEIRIYDAQNKEIWNSVWTGNNTNMKFKKKMPTAHHIVIKAQQPFVVNKQTFTRIYQDKPMQLKYTLL